jgi:hypothetical protein
LISSSENLEREIARRSEMNSNCRYLFVNNQTTASAKQNDRRTIWMVPGGFPNLKGPEAEKLYDINKLEQVHR